MIICILFVKEYTEYVYIKMCAKTGPYTRRNELSNQKEKNKCKRTAMGYYKIITLYFLSK